MGKVGSSIHASIPGMTVVSTRKTKQGLRNMKRFPYIDVLISCCLDLWTRSVVSAVEDGTKGRNASSPAATHQVPGARGIAGHHNHLSFDLAHKPNGQSQTVWSATLQGVIQVDPCRIDAGQQIHCD